MSTVDRGPSPMLVVDASCLYEMVARREALDEVGARLASDPDHVAPHIIDVEVFGAVRRDWLAGALDGTAADAALRDLENWPGERLGHWPLLARAWELRHTVRGWDAMYVALAEALDVPLITRDKRLAAATGPTCLIEVPG